MAMGINLALVDGSRRKRDGSLSLSQVRGKKPDPPTDRTGRNAYEVLPRRRRGMEAGHRQDTRVAIGPCDGRDEVASNTDADPQFMARDHR
jgi:hypothetical protein